MKPNVVIINEKDNVAVSLEDIAAGAPVLLPGGREIPALSGIPYSHKVALCDIAAGQDIVKYGEVIGQAKAPVKKGEWVHTHNLIIN